VRVRRTGGEWFSDLAIGVDPRLPIGEAHELATRWSRGAGIDAWRRLVVMWNPQVVPEAGSGPWNREPLCAGRKAEGLWTGWTKWRWHYHSFGRWNRSEP